MDLERGEVPRVGREGALYERFRVPQAFVASACVIAVEDLEDIGHRDACEGVGIVRDVFQSALEEVACRNYGLSRCRPVDHGLTSHDEVDGRGARGAFAAPCLNVDHLQACGARQACYNLVLNLEKALRFLSNLSAHTSTFVSASTSCALTRTRVASAITLPLMT